MFRSLFILCLTLITALTFANNSREACDRIQSKTEQTKIIINNVNKEIKEVEAKVYRLKTNMNSLFKQINNSLNDVEDLNSVTKKIALLRDAIIENVFEICRQTQQLINAETKSEQYERLQKIENLREAVQELKQQTKVLKEGAVEVGDKLNKVNETVDEFIVEMGQVKLELENIAPEVRNTEWEVEEARNDTEKLKDFDAEDCLKEAASLLEQATRRQNRLEQTLIEVQNDLNSLTEEWEQNAAKQLLKSATNNTHAVQKVINIIMRGVAARLKDSETCERFAQEAATRPPKFTIPNVIGRTISEAMDILDGLELVITATGAEPAPTSEQSLTVKSQTPEAGSKANVGDRLLLKIYKRHIIEGEEEGEQVEIKEKEKTEGFIVVARIFWPSPHGTPPKDAQAALAWYRALRLRDVTLKPDVEFIYLNITGDALKRYPIEFLKAQKKISLSMNISGSSTETGELKLSGANLLEIENIYTDREKLAADHPDASDVRKVFVFDNTKGTFGVYYIEQGRRISITGGPIIYGWPQEMREKALNLFKKLILISP